MPPTIMKALAIIFVLVRKACTLVTILRYIQFIMATETEIKQDMNNTSAADGDKERKQIASTGHWCHEMFNVNPSRNVLLSEYK